MNAPIRPSFALVALLLAGCGTTRPPDATRAYRETLVFRGTEDTTPSAVSFHEHRTEDRSPVRMKRQ